MAMSFAKSVAENVRLVQEELDKNVTNFVAETFKDVVKLSPSEWKNSPYATGWLVNQWYPSTGVPSSSLTQSKDIYGMNSLDRINTFAESKPFLRKDNTVFLTNSVPYAYQAEAIGWKYADKYAMIAQSVDKAKAKLA